MTRRALLIGSATAGLTGVAHDVEVMSTWLGEHGFGLDVRRGEDATREGMLEGLRRLEHDCRPGDSAVVYYSGHGGYSQVPSFDRVVQGRVAPRAVQYLVPTDHDKHGSFRGIFRSELSLALGRLAEQTTNITVILDCCHSADVVRKDDAVVKGIIEPWGKGIEAHLSWLRAQGYELDRLPVVRSSSVVLLSACEVTRQAYEISRSSDGTRCGLFTDCLLEVARTITDPSRVTWDDLMRRVVELTRRHRSHQRPQLSGPSSRFLFTERLRHRLGALTLEQGRRGWCLSAGEAAGVWPGDRYAIIDPLGEAGPALAEMTVTEVAVSTAQLTVNSATKRAIQAGMVAVPRPGGPAHLGCRIDGSGPLYEPLRRRMATIPGLEILSIDDPRSPAFTLQVDDRCVRVLDGDGASLHWPWMDTDSRDAVSREERLDGLVEQLREILRGSELLELARRLEHESPPQRLSHVLGWGRVEQDQGPLSLPERGAELMVGDRVFICIENTSPWPLRVSVFDVGVGRAVTLLNPNEPEGIDLGSGEMEIIGAGEMRTLTGLELGWPDQTPADGPREESLVVVVSSHRLPLTSWETSSWCESPTLRDMAPQPNRPPKQTYLIRRVTFRLHPNKQERP